MSTSDTCTDAERELEDRFERELDAMIAHQRRKCLELARRLRPGLTEDDIAQPHDFPELRENWHWNYEEGHLSGLLAARAGLGRVAAARRREPD
jgi:hypothetical protein